MKTTFLLGTALIFSVYLNAGNGNGSAKNKNPEKYCAKMKDGKMMVMHEGNALTADASLSNGTMVKMDGTIVNGDGTTVVLKEGECIDKDGKIMKETMKNKNKTPNK